MIRQLAFAAWIALCAQALACNQILGIHDGCMSCSDAFKACQNGTCDISLVCEGKQLGDFKNTLLCACGYCDQGVCAGFCPDGVGQPSPPCARCIEQSVGSSMCACPAG